MPAQVIRLVFSPTHPQQAVCDCGAVITLGDSLLPVEAAEGWCPACGRRIVCVTRPPKETDHA